MDENTYTRNDDYIQIFKSDTDSFVSLGQIQTAIGNRIGNY